MPRLYRSGTFYRLFSFLPQASDRRFFPDPGTVFIVATLSDATRSRKSSFLQGSNLLQPPATDALARFREGFGQRFIVTVDTEEEFDWDAPLDRRRHSTLTLPALRKFQQFCEGFGVVPIYLLDYPVADSPDTVAAIGDAVDAGRAEVGSSSTPG